MKKNYLALLCFLVFGLAGTLQAQSHKKNLKPNIIEKAVKYRTAAHTGLETAKNIGVPANQDVPVAFRSTAEIIVGTTRYDLQSNAANQRRIIHKPDGTIAATFTFSKDDLGNPDRGTGYNTNAGGSWGPEPTAALEASRRTGWPALVNTPNGEVVVCHYSPEPYAIHVLRKQSGGSWLESDIASRTPRGLLWPRAASGGPDGNSVHACAVTVPVANDNDNPNAIYRGIDGHLLYFRSLDAGATWDKRDIILPQIDSSKYVSMSADAYSIDAKGNTVAVALFGTWADVVVSISRDNGETWETRKVYDFPLPDKYDLMDGYTSADIPSVPDSLGTPNSEIEIFASDGAGEVYIDDDGVVHVVFAGHYVEDSDFSDQGWNFYPGLTSIYYWNETFATDELINAAGLLDSDGDGSFTLQGQSAAGNWGQAYCSYPSISGDADGNLYLAYSALMENYWNENANPELQHYRHVLACTSTDGGLNWSTPYDIINPELSDPDFYSFFEGVFPSMAREVKNGKIDLLYQQDTEPGSIIVTNGDADPADNNNIVYLSLSIDRLTGTNDFVKNEEVKLNVYPNPTQENVLVGYELKQSANVSLQLFDMNGKNVQSIQLGERQAGSFVVPVNMQNLASGLYFLKLQMGAQFTTTKIQKL